MSSNAQKSTSAAPKPAQLQTTAGPNNPNLRLEKVAARTTTPDSEALASSDDEGDQRLDSATGPAHLHKPARRSSWLNDTSHPFASPRKASLPTNSLSPTTSNPTTPSGEPGSGPWGSQSTSIMGRTSGSAAYPWGTGIWNAERKEAPSRLSEVLPSPTSTGPMGMGNGGFFSPESNLSPGGPGSRDPATNAPIPFAIPLHPTPKTYRSQSYSVGQLEPEATSPGNISAGAHLGRSRHPGLQHRPSRPSMLSEMSNDGTMLGKVKEVEDDEDDESLSESMQGSFHQSSESKTIEMLTRENAMLRQQQQYSHRMRPRAPTGGSAYMGNGYSPVPEESDYAVDELDEINDSGESFARRAANRRMSEYGSGPIRSPIGLESRKTDNANLKKALWSTTLGFPVGDISQSRRHSFANMPTRQGSISSIADSASVLEGSTADLQNPQDYAGAYGENQALSGNGTAAAYFGGPNLANAMPTTFTNPFSTPFNMPQQYANRAPSPHRNVYGMGQPRHNQLLHIVLFKCARADVFYIQEGTGLTVKPGDLVIVEADRGTDLGTVGKDNVDWQTAKELKEHYAEEQYKWLMMYSQGAAAAQEGSGAGLLASSGLQGSTVGGMGPPNQHHMQEPNAGELRPKLIKRLAQSHEVQALRDKEGQEAKAKRVCMQKVKEHGLNMEILDAEFQMDWKKLTFYYFADAYINFNSLVTDLFKIYKTRIWMSAINPASFASPTLGIQAPSGIGPGAVGVGRSSGGGERRYNAQMQQQQQQSQQVQEQQAQAYGAPGQGGRGFRPAYNQGFGADRNAPNSGYPPSNYGLGPAGIFGNGRGSSYVTGVVPISEAFGTAGYPQQVGDFQSMQQRFPPGSIPSPTPRSQGVSPISPQSDWTGAFQGLSLNTH